MFDEWVESPTLADRVNSKEIKGDKSVPKTTRWNRLFLKLFVWKWVVFQLDSAWVATHGPYYVGFIPGSGIPTYKISARRDLLFAMRIGHESCRFFVIGARDESPELQSTTQSWTWLQLWNAKIVRH